MERKTFNDKNRELILILQKDPLANFVDIAKKLNSTPPTAKRRMEELMGIEGTERYILGVSAIPNVNRIGLEDHTYFVDIEPDSNNNSIKKLFEVADYHPYTSYQNRCFGSVTGSMLQFNIPHDTENYMDKLFKELKDHINIKKVHHYDHPDVKLNSYPEIKQWKSDHWDFNFTNWFEEAQSDENTEKQSSEAPSSESLLQELEMTHVILLREQMINSRRKQVELMADIRNSSQYSVEEKTLFEKDKQRQVSRDLEFLTNEKIITGHQLLYDRVKFGIFNQLAFYGEMSSEMKDKIIHAFDSNKYKLPFRSQLSFYKEKYLWWLNLPPIHSSQAMNFVFNISKKFKQ